MNTPIPDAREGRLHDVFRRFTVAASAAAIIVGLGVLAGWWLGLGWVSSALPTLVSMKPIVALCLACAGGSLALLSQPHAAGARRRAGQLLACAVGLFGLLTVAEYASGLDFGIDGLAAPAALSPPEGFRPSFSAAVDFLLLAAALLLIDAQLPSGHRPTEYLAVAIGLTAVVAIAGDATGAAPVDGMPTRLRGSALAMDTALFFLLLAIGLLCARPRAGLMAGVTSPHAGGYMARRMLLAVGLFPVLGVLVAVGVHLGLYSAHLGVSVLEGLEMLVGVCVVLIIGGRLNDADEERRRAAQALAKMQQRERDLMEQAPDGVFVADLEGRYTDVNGAGARMLGYTRDQIVGKTIAELILAEEVPRLARARQVLLDGATQVAEWHLRRSDGVFIPVEVSAKILADGRWQAFARDISERQLAEQRLRAAEEKFRGLLESAQDAIVVVDRSGRIEFVNRQVLAWFGYGPGELIGQPVEQLVPGPLAQGHRALRSEYMQQPVARPMGRQLELMARRKDGSEFPIEVSLSPFIGGGVDSTVITAIVHDITERKRAEDQQRFLSTLSLVLAQSLDLRVILENVVHLAVPELADWCVVDIVGRDGVVRRLAMVHRDASKQALAEELLRLTPGPLDISEGVEKALATRTPILVRDVRPEWIEQTAHDPHRAQLVRELGARSYIVIPLFARDAGIGSLTFVAANRNFTEQDLAFARQIGERAAQAADNARLYQKAQAAIRSREDVLAVVSHDLKNPLNTIRISGESLFRGLPQSMEPEQVRERVRSAAQRIIRSTDRAARLISDLLDFAVIEAGNLRVVLGPERAADLLQETVESMTQLAESSSIELTARAPRELKAHCDRARVLQVLENLVGNAIKFNRPGGHVVIQAEPGPEGHLLFSVRDDGPGIPEQHAERIFDRYWQAAATQRQGTGLGLAIARGLVEAHHGHLWVNSRVGEGSTFFFTLPSAQRVVEETSTAAPH